MNIRKKLRLQRRVKMGVVVCSLGFMVSGIIMNITNANFRQTDKPTVIRIVENSQPIQAQTISTQEHTEQYSKLPYPFDTMSFDWSGEQIAGFKEYQIPDDYELYGGYFPLEMQEYTYIICKDYGVDYSLIIAMIEIESGYKYDTVGKGGDIGYMQINQEWHTDRMERLGATDLKNPYQNVRVGIDYMAELLGQYQTSVAVSAYNRGAHNDSGTGALDLADKGQYQTEYSEKVLNRAAEIEKELSQ